MGYRSCSRIKQKCVSHNYMGKPSPLPEPHGSLLQRCAIVPARLKWAGLLLWVTSSPVGSGREGKHVICQQPNCCSRWSTIIALCMLSTTAMGANNTAHTLGPHGRNYSKAPSFAPSKLLHEKAAQWAILTSPRHASHAGDGLHCINYKVNCILIYFVVTKQYQCLSNAACHRILWHKLTITAREARYTQPATAKATTPCFIQTLL